MDLYLRAPTQAQMDAAMRATYELLAGVTLDADAPTPTMANFAGGDGAWVVDVIPEGFFREETGEVIETEYGPQPVTVARGGAFVILRWNTGQPIPPVPEFIEIVWRSDQVDAEGNPVPPPTWWNRVLA